MHEMCGLSERAHKRRAMLVGRICEELDVHAQIEEKIFYPAIRAADEAIGKLVLESFEEHALVKKLVAELLAMNESDERFMAKTTVLKELVSHHVDDAPPARARRPRNVRVCVGARATA
jgi:hypothetical protein